MEWNKGKDKECPLKKKLEETDDQIIGFTQSDCAG